MDNLTSFLYISPLFHTSLIHHPPTHSLTSLSARVTSVSGEALPAVSRSSSYSRFQLFDDLRRFNSLNSVKQAHAQLIKSPKSSNPDVVYENLIACYLEFGDFGSAARVFFLDFKRNYLLWRLFLEDYKSFGGDPVGILDVFGELYRKGINFDCRIITVVLKFCAILMDLWLGIEIHTCLIKRGFDLDVHLKCALMNFYGRCWGIDYALEVFDEMPDREVALWNEAIVACLRNESPSKALMLFQDMQISSVTADNFTIAKVLQACAKGEAIEEGKQVHGYVFRNAMERDVSVCNPLINMYVKNDNVKLARRVFDLMGEHNVSSWNSMISGLASIGCFDEAWELFHEMELHNVKPDTVTWNCLLSSHLQHGLYREVLVILSNMLAAKSKPNSSSITPAIQAVSELNLMKLGMEIHGFVTRNGLDCDEYVGSTLLEMYVKNNDLVKARVIFDLLKPRNNVAWNSLISGYSLQGLFDDALCLLKLMQEEGIETDIVTWNGLVSGYALNGLYDDAFVMIEQMKASGVTPNVVSWTALISGCSQNGNYNGALKFFNRMQQEGVKPNLATISILLHACGGLSLLPKGKEIHSMCIRNGFVKDVPVATALIDMYIKSGSLTRAYEIFQAMKNKTVATWNCMIMGFAIYSRGKEAIILFDEMRNAGMHPDAITFTALLSGCKNSGLHDEGWKYFDSMTSDYNITPSIQHYSCMVDLLGRTGYLDEAWDFIQTMPFKPDASVWGALLQSCRVHNNLELGKIAAEKVIELEPDNSANYVMMMNIYSMSKRWEDVDYTRQTMIARGLRFQYGYSWMQIDHKLHIFSEDNPHPDIGDIYFELYKLVSEMRKAGYVPDIRCVNQNINDEEKEKLLLTHTEKLAVTYGLMKMKSNGSPIRVIKSTRMCSDCHTAAKFISLITNREILVKEGARFHHFQEGKCSCNDFW